MRQIHSARRRERGLFVLAFATLFIVIGLGLVTHRLATADQGGPVRNERVTQDALREAKLALLAFAADNRNRPGGLPCPDRDGDGEAELTCDRPETRVGWLPWQTLASGPLRDSSGELLWYALAAEYRNDPDIAINSATHGSVRITQSHGTLDDLAAVVIAPGNAQSGQIRIRRNADNRDAFIESVTRADASGIELHLNGNDRGAPLATTELWRKVEPMVALRLVREIAPIIESRYAREWGALPYPAAFTDPRATRRGAPVIPSDRGRRAAGDHHRFGELVEQLDCPREGEWRGHARRARLSS